MNLDLKFVRDYVIRSLEANLFLWNIVSKPASSWIGKSYNRSKGDENWEKISTLSLLLKRIQCFQDFIMDERWIPVSRECALIANSAFKKWCVVWFAILTMIILIIEVCCNLNLTT